MCVRNGTRIALWLFLSVTGCWAQPASAVLSGTVTDPAGATVPGAKLTLFSGDTGLTRSLRTGDTGQFVFPLLAPGRYQLRVETKGFKLLVYSDVVLAAAQAARINPVLEISAEPQQIVVDGNSAILNTSALDYTLRASALQNMPMQGRNFLNLAGAAPGVVGRGSLDNFDNFAPEKDFDFSANGRGSVGNTFFLDGLNVTSNIVMGVSNLSPNPDSVEELTVQTNSFTVDQGRTSSLQISMVSKGGTNRFHGAASYFFTNQDLLARSVFTDRYDPFKKHNLAGSLGGPVVRNKAFFFSSFEMLRSSVADANSVQTYESPEFVAFAVKNFPGSLGTRALTEAPLINVTTHGVAKRASDVIGGECGTPASRMMPCGMPLLMEGEYRPNWSRDGLQYNFRGDRYFRDGRDRVYGNYYRTALDLGNPPLRAGMDNSTVFGSHAVEGAWTHTFSPGLICETSFSGIQVGADSAPEARYHIPEINIAGQSTNITPGWGGLYSQHNYNWRNLVSWVRGSHVVKFGGSLYWSDDAADFTRTTARPVFFFRNLLDLVSDRPQSESGVGYDPLTGQPGQFAFGGKITTSGLFVQDEWNAAHNLTVTMGFRWDDFGEPAGTQDLRFTTLDYGGGATGQNVANARLLFNNQAYDHRLNRNFGFRGGVAWSPGKAGVWTIRGGMGLYYDWVALGQSVDLLRQNPPNFIFPTFRTDGGIRPVFNLGTSDTHPFGFYLPAIPSSQFDERGGLVGARPNIGFLASNLSSPRTLNYLLGVERRVAGSLSAGANYSGSYTGNALLGTDFNRGAADLLDGAFDRLNPSFGSMSGVWNGNVIRHHALTATVRMDLPSALLQASYTLSRTTDCGQAGTRQSRDDAYAIPDQSDPCTYQRSYADWDARHRFSLTGSWRLPTVPTGNRLANSVIRGWEVSTIAILQSGTPFTVVNRNPFDPILNAAGNVVGMKPDSGDYNADGFNYDYPNAPQLDFAASHSRAQFIDGLFSKADFPVPASGTQGNLRRNAFRNPGLFTVDAAMIKNYRLPAAGDTGNLQLRFEFFNALNRVNLQGVDNNLGSATFGRSTAAYSPRMIQVGLRLVF